MNKKTNKYGGYNTGAKTKQFGVATKAYSTWRAMMRRCYGERTSRNNGYSGVEVCNEWKDFYNFNDWHNEKYVTGYEIDKDLMSGKSVIYSPDTCVFIPKIVNKMITTKGSKNSLPVGVRSAGSRSLKFRVAIYKNGVAKDDCSFTDKHMAADAYKKSKESHVKSEADKMFNSGLISKRIHYLLHLWEV